MNITSLADFCVDGTQEKVDEAKKQILSGENGVFDGVIETKEVLDTFGRSMIVPSS